MESTQRRRFAKLRARGRPVEAWALHRAQQVAQGRPFQPAALPSQRPVHYRAGRDLVDGQRSDIRSRPQRWPSRRHVRHPFRQASALGRGQGRGCLAADRRRWPRNEHASRARHRPIHGFRSRCRHLRFARSIQVARSDRRCRHQPGGPARRSDQDRALRRPQSIQAGQLQQAALPSQRSLHHRGQRHLVGRNRQQSRQGQYGPHAERQFRHAFRQAGALGRRQGRGSLGPHRWRRTGNADAGRGSEVGCRIAPLVSPARDACRTKVRHLGSDPLSGLKKMQARDGIVDAIGNTPLIVLKRASAATQCTILGKAEFMNPGQSVKDRPARQIILEAEKRGEIKPGGLVVEATAGNTGIGLALVANARGYRTLIVIPETQSQEKKDMLRLCGAELVEVPALPYANPNSYQHVGKRLADRLRKTEPNGVLFADQWNNLDNAKAHCESTGPEIWQQTGGKIDGFICSVGTGGTLAGISAFLKEKNKGIVVACADPQGFAMYELFKHGEAKSTPGDSITEGIGLGRVTPVIKTAEVDDAFLISDEEAVTVIYELLEHEGLCLGGSTGINIAGAVRLAKQLGPGKTIVTILCDSGNRYQSKLFNPDFMRSKKLPVPEWLEKRTKIDVPYEKV